MKRLNRREFFSCILAAIVPAWFLKKKTTEWRVPLKISNRKAFEAVDLRSAADAITEQQTFIIDCFRSQIYTRGQMDVADTPLYDTIPEASWRNEQKSKLHGDTWSTGPWRSVASPLAVFAVSAVLAVSPARAQGIPHACFQAFHFTGSGQIQQMADNLQTLCNNFTISYSAQGFGSLSLLVQDAPDAGNTPGTWVTYGGTVNTGINPNTSITGGNATTTFTGFFRWMRVNLTAVTGTGTVDGVIYGDQVGPGTGASSGGGGCASPCTVIGPTAQGSPSANPPVQISVNDGNGNLIIPTIGSLSTPLNVSASGLTQVIALSAAKSIRLTHISLGFLNAVNFQLEYGTGANCGAGTTALTGTYQAVLSIALDFELSPLVVPASNALCVNLGSSVTGGGLAKYALF